MARRSISALQRTELFGCLSELELEDIGHHLIELHFKKGQAIFLAGEPGRGLFVVVRGQVTVFQDNIDGREQVMHVDSDGAVIGTVPVFDGGAYPASATCKTDVDAFFFEKDAMCRFCAKYPPLALRALRQMAELVREHSQLVEALSFHEVGQRLALLVLSEVRRVNTTENQIAFVLPLSNQEIANRIGSVRDVVSRAFAHLRRDRLVIKKGRTLLIPDRRALELYAENIKKTEKDALPDPLKRIA